MSAVVSDATRRDMAELVRRYLDRADTDDHRDQLVNLASLLRHATAHNAALSGAVEHQVAELRDAQAALDILVQENARLARVQGKAHEPVSEQAWLGHRPDELAIPSPTAAAPGVVGDDHPGVGEPPAPAPGRPTSRLLGDAAAQRKEWPAGASGGPTPEITTRKGNPVSTKSTPHRPRHRWSPGRPSPADLGATFPPSRHKRTAPLGDIYGRLEFDRILAHVNRRLAGGVR